MEVPHLGSIMELKEFFVQYQNPILNLKIGIDKYGWITQQLRHYKYFSLNKKEKAIVIQLIQFATNYSREYCLLLIAEQRKGNLKHKIYQRQNIRRIYTHADIALLSETDVLHKRLNAEATKMILIAESKVHVEYENIAKVSTSHLNNLRKRTEYKCMYLNGTKANVVMIGDTRKPITNGMPGAIRVDSVHQRDVYYVNFVDEITQWEIVICVEAINEKCLAPLLELALKLFPFTVFNFHSDRGSEFINAVIAKVLNQLLINQTKSRSRHCNDNALVETKNTIIRKEMGYMHIEKSAAEEINNYLLNYYMDYLDYHRPCRFQTGEKVSKKGRKYAVHDETKTPFNKLVELEYQLRLQCFGQTYLQIGITLEDMYLKSEEKTPNDYAREMRKAKNELVTKLNQKFSGRTLVPDDFTDNIQLV